MIEDWKEVPDTNGRYIVSAEGRIAKVLCPTSSWLYKDVTLYVEGKKIRKYLHRLILEVFVGPAPTKKHEGNHKDGNKHNNSLANLEWVTPSENRYHAYRVLGRRAASGSKNGFYGKFGAQNPAAKTYIVTNPNGRELKITGLNKFCKEMGLDVGTMSSVANGKYGAKTHKGWKCRHV